METGDDGRFYDSHYDFNHNGHLDINEQLLYDDDVYGHGTGGGSYRRRTSGSQSAGAGLIMLLYICAMAFELFIAALCAPVGVIMMYFTIRLKEKLLR